MLFFKNSSIKYTNKDSSSFYFRDESNSNSSRSNGYPAATNAADMRHFNGTNRSDTTSQLMKGSQWAYGNNNGEYCSSITKISVL